MATCKDIRESNVRLRQVNRELRKKVVELSKRLQGMHPKSKHRRN